MLLVITPTLPVSWRNPAGTAESIVLGHDSPHYPPHYPRELLVGSYLADLNSH